MAIRLNRDDASKPVSKSSTTKSGDVSRRTVIKDKLQQRARQTLRDSLLETLEPRNLMAVGPQLIGVQPNNSDLISDGVVRNVAPRELTFRFDDSQIIDASTLSGIRLSRSGNDGSFGLPTVATDFGTNGRVDIQLTSVDAGKRLNVEVSSIDRGTNGAPVFAVAATTSVTDSTPLLRITLNANASTPTTAGQLVNAINNDASLQRLVKAKINGGFSDTKIGTLLPAGFAQIKLLQTNDVSITPANAVVGSAPNENEVTFRFAENLPDDLYRIEVFGFDDASNNIVGLRNVVAGQTRGDLFVPSVSNTRQDTVDFRLDLGSKITGVVPQPVVRLANGTLTQQRDTIVVYFDNDKLFVENNAAGNPTSQSAENPAFYQLISTSNSVRNTDDVVFTPARVVYNASANTATLTFAKDIDALLPTGTERSAFRLRVGTRETTPITPTRSIIPDLGDTFVGAVGAANLGTIGSTSINQTSRIITSTIETVALGLDRVGASNDPGQRDLGATNFENHINELFGADNDAGITQISYNFAATFNGGTGTVVNSITEAEKERIREGLHMWSQYLGVTFTETENSGITFATGILNQLAGATVQIENNFNFRTRIDPNFANSALLMDINRPWNTAYGEDYYRTAMAGIGMMLGLEHAGDLPASTIMAMYSGFLNGTLNAQFRNLEPSFPGAQDIIHGQFVHSPDSNDIDLYRFDIDFGPNGQTRTGTFEAETLAQRAANPSNLDTYLALYKQTQATAISNFGAGENLQIQFTAIAPGKLGNHLQVFVARSNLGVGALPVVGTGPNAITIELNSTAGSETTAAQLITALNGNAAARGLATFTLLSGSGATILGNREITYSPIELVGGDIVKISQNDNYFGNDSLIRMQLSSGRYYIGVSSTGNDNYDATIANSGKNGRTEGRYDLRLNFRAQVDETDSIRDVVGQFFNDVGQPLDGDSDGIVGGTYNFWFETRPLNRIATVNSDASTALQGQTITITGANGIVRRFEFSSTTSVGLGNIRIPYTVGQTAISLASAMATVIQGQTALGVSVTTNGASLVFTGERTVQLSANLIQIDLEGKVIFVDKLAGPNADGSLAHPFNNISNPAVPNAFGAAISGDIVRIVGNGGADGNLATVRDNYAYEFGFGLLANSILTDGTSLDVPKGVITMIDGGAVLKSRRSKISVGSSNSGIDRSGGALQILGAPVIVENNRAVRNTDGTLASGNVIFTSYLDETTGLDTYGPTTTPAAGDWGGIIFQRDIDRDAGRADKEDQGIFLNYVNGADIRYGGGGNVVIDAVQQIVNPIQMIDYRPTITNNKITFSADAAMSAAPNSFEETLFTDSRYQSNGEFTPDYNRVGPTINGNRLVNNSLNGLFIKVLTLAGQDPRTLTVAGRFNDIDITHIISENVEITGAPGGNRIDTTRPDANFVTVDYATNGTLTPGTYNYIVTFVDRYGAESVQSSPTTSITLSNIGLPLDQTAISVQGLPSVQGDYSKVRVYRSSPSGVGPYSLAAELDKAQSSFIDNGTNLGGVLVRDVSRVSAVAAPVGTLATGTYTYRITSFDSTGFEGTASNETRTFTVGAGNARLTLSNLPLAESGFAGRRIYRSANGGNGPFILVGILPNSTSATVTTFVDTGATAGGGVTLPITSEGVVRVRNSASLAIDPGTVVKLEGSRIEIGIGAQLIAEGTPDLPIIFTSKLDDTYGAGGTFDTNNNGTANAPTPRNWGGIYASPGSNISLDHSQISYAGGITRLDGTFRAFNALEIQQAEARVANTLFSFNEDGVGGQGPSTRFGRLENESAVIFVRGSSPVFLNNTFLNNFSVANDNGIPNSVSINRIAPITIDANSMTNELQGDTGRQTLGIDRTTTLDYNRGPLFRGNKFTNNDLNGLKIRGDNRSNDANLNIPSIGDDNIPTVDARNLAPDELTVESVWDDTDIVHVLYEGIFVGNLAHGGGLRLQSSATESLVVKMIGGGTNFDPLRGTGLTATGDKSSISDRVGGTVHIVGQPGFPVVMTSLRDDTVGAGLRIDGRPQTDTNNDGIGSIPAAGDWRGIFLDQNSNDRNVAIVLEKESPNAVAPGVNGTTQAAQVLGQLAEKATNSDENLRLGFSVQGVLSQPEDVDTYSFSAVGGTEVWFDIDNTSYTLDTVIELLDASGNLLARSDNSTAETADTLAIVTTTSIPASRVNSLDKQVSPTTRRNADGSLKEDGTSNPRDAGFRVVLPGTNGSRSGYFFRVRSASSNPNNFNAGNTSGSYEVQVRLRETQEFAGSTVQTADIRYAVNGVHLQGLPAHSPLLGEIGEDESVTGFADTGSNDVPFSFTLAGPGVPYSTGDRPQYIGNILNSDRGVMSVAGGLANGLDTDFYRFSLSQRDVVRGVNSLSNLVFDIDYADGYNRPDTLLTVYRFVTTTAGAESYQLIYTGDGSNIAEDQSTPLSGTAPQDFSQGSNGVNDPFINTNSLPEGEYLIAVTSSQRSPSEFTDIPVGTNGPIRVPFTRIVNPTTLTVTTATPTASSPVFNLTGYAASDLPAAYFEYNETADRYDVDILVNGVVQATDGNPVINNNNFYTEGLQFVGANRQAKIDLSAYAGQANVTVRFRLNNTTPTATISNFQVGFAERGEQILNAPVRDQAYTTFFVGFPTANVSGNYQLEVRRVDAPTITDTNQRDATATALIMPSGAVINAATNRVFTISDGSSMVSFEFSSTGTVGAGNVRLPFLASDSAVTIAQRLRDAINSSGVQSRFNIKAAGADGSVSTPLTGNRLNLFGNAIVSGFLSVANGRVVITSGNGDQNVARDQGQVLITGNFIRQARDYGVWSEAGRAEYDPRDAVNVYTQSGLMTSGDATMSGAEIIQSRPALVGSAPGAARNLPVLNDSLVGGFAAGVIVSNNVLENGGLGGVHIAGENPIFMLSPNIAPIPAPVPTTTGIPASDNTTGNTAFTHFGQQVDDGDTLTLDFGRTRVVYEFEDISGATPAPNIFGSGTVGGNGWNPENIPIYYREDTGNLYQNEGRGSSALEVMQSIRDSILGSVLVTNGTTQNVRATVGLSMLPPDLLNGGILTRGNPNFADRPALYLEGVTGAYFTNVGVGYAFTGDFLDRTASPQPFARVINNTIIGNDGRASYNPDQGASESNDTISTAVQTMQGSSHNPFSYTLNTAAIGDNTALADRSTDVDYYQVKMDIGDVLNVQTGVPATNAATISLQLIDENGRRVVINPGATNTTVVSGGAFSYVATSPGIYYIAASGAGNEGFDPLSLASRTSNTSSGGYTINVNVAHPQEFVITVDDPANLIGRTFEISQVAVTPGVPSTRVFEFTNNGGYNGPNVPVFLGAGFRVPDVARAIAGAINASGLNNQQNLANGSFAAANPIPAVQAVALGGVSGNAAGLTTFVNNRGFTQRSDSAVFVNGFGHNRSGSAGLGGTSPGDGTTEKFVVIRNAAWVRSNGSIRVDPDFDGTNNLDQIIPETGVFVSAGATPTVMNNVFYNIQTPIVSEETANGGFGLSQLQNNHPKQIQVVGGQPIVQVIVGGSTYQYTEPAIARNRLGSGIEVGPTNVPNTQLDFNNTIAGGQKLFVNAQAGQYLPSNSSVIIDSSIDSLPERTSFSIDAIKAGAGISPSPVLAPSVDAQGLLRVDDPNVAPPQGLGSNVFKDRGALERADFIGPSVQLLSPLDNDSQNIDKDPSISYVKLTDGKYQSFRIQLSDSSGTVDPFAGVGIDDDSVVGPTSTGLRLPGAVVTLTQDGRALTEGVDYIFAYNSTTKEIILTPIAGVWQNNHVYEITLNNRNRFVLKAPAGDQVADGSKFTINDTNGGVVNFEFDSGYQLQLPTGLQMAIPISGGGAGGVQDGDRFSITVVSPTAGQASRTIVFELDRNSNVLPGNVAVPFLTTNNNLQVATAIANAITTAFSGTGYSVVPQVLSDGTVYIGVASGSYINTFGSVISQPISTIGISVPDFSPGVVLDGQAFSISDGRITVAFEYDDNNAVTTGNIAIDVSTVTSTTDLTAAIIAAIKTTALAVQPSQFGTNVIHLGLPASGTVNPGTTGLQTVGVSRALVDGQTLSIQLTPNKGFVVPGYNVTTGIQTGQTFSVVNGANTVVFEFTTSGAVTPPAAGQPAHIPIVVTTNMTGTQIATAMRTAILAQAGLGISPVVSQIATVAGGSTTQTVLDLGNISTLSLDLGTSRMSLTGVLVDNNSIRTLTGYAPVSRTFEFDLDTVATVGTGNIRIPVSSSATQDDIGVLLAQAISSSGLGLKAVHLRNGNIAIGGTAQYTIGVFDPVLPNGQANPATNVTISGSPGVTSSTILAIIGSLVLNMPRGSSITDNSTFSITGPGNVSRIFEFDSDNSGPSVAGNVAIGFLASSDAVQIANQVANTINAITALGVTARVLPGGRLDLGNLADTAVNVSNSGITLSRGAVTDGDFFSVTNGTQTVTFEFDNTSLNNGRTAGRTAIQYTNTSTQAEIAEALRIAIEGAGLGITGSNLGNAVQLFDTPQFTYNLAGTNSLARSGVAGGAIAIPFYRDASYTAAQVRESIVRAINAAPNTNLSAITRVDDTLFVENAVSVSPEISSFFLQGIKDLAGNNLAANRFNQETQFTILTSGSRVDFGDSPDPVSTTVGRYPTLFGSNGAQHVVSGTDEIQVVGWTAGRQLAGTFRLTINDGSSSFTTGALAFNASAAAVRTAIGALPMNSDAALILQTVNALSTTATITAVRNAITALPVSTTRDLALASLVSLPLTATRANALTTLTPVLQFGANNVNVRLLAQPAGSFNVSYEITFTGNRIANNMGQTTIDVTTLTGDAALKSVASTEVEGVSTLRLGSLQNTEADGVTSPDALGDLGDDGVRFVSSTIAVPGFPLPTFNKNILTTITVTANAPGFLDGWIDFNYDGDWSDPGEQIAQSIEFTEGNLTQTIQVRVPENAALPTTNAVKTFARFRMSTEGGLQPTGLALNGEVEDYAVTIARGTPPTGVNNTYTMDEDSTLTTTDPTGATTAGFPDDDGIAANDINFSASPLTVQLITGPTNAKTFTLNANGTFTYTPNNNFAGVDTFVYRVFDNVLGAVDAAGAPAYATVTINVQDVNDAPVAPVKNISVASNKIYSVTTANFLSTSSAGAGESTQTLTISRIDATSARGGVVRIVNGNVEYVPPANFAGTDSFTYRITDNGFPPLSANGTVQITVLQVPNAVNDTLATEVNTAITRGTQVLLQNDSAIDPQNSLSLTAISPTGSRGGTIVLSGNSFTYTPPTNFNGTETFTYTLQENSLQPLTSTGTVTVTVTDTNDAPRMTRQLGTLTVAEDATVTALDLSTYFTDPDIVTNNDVLAYSVRSNSNTALVTASIANTNRLNLVLGADKNGTASIVVRATDKKGAFVESTLTLTVTPVADPIRVIGSIPNQSIDKNSPPLVVKVLPTFLVDPDAGTPGNTTTFTAVSSDVSLITVSTNPTTGELTVTPQPNQSGRATVTVTVRNTNGGAAVNSSFDVIVNAVNLAPTGVVDSYTVPANGTLRTTIATGAGASNTRGVLANDTDPEGDTLSTEIVASPTRGSLLLNTDGTFTYTPNAGSVAQQTDFFTYRAVDTQGLKSAITRVNIGFTTKLPSTHQNQSNFFDVNADGVVSSIDALLIINFVSRNPGSTDITTIAAAPPYRDVNGDYSINQIDILNVINQLARRLGPNGEGESTSSSVQGTTSTVATPVTLNAAIVPAVTSIDVGGVPANKVLSMVPVTTLGTSVTTVNNQNQSVPAIASSQAAGSVYDGIFDDEDETEAIVSSVVGDGSLSGNAVDSALIDLLS